MTDPREIKAAIVRVRQVDALDRELERLPLREPPTAASPDVDWTDWDRAGELADRIMARLENPHPRDRADDN